MNAWKQTGNIGLRFKNVWSEFSDKLVVVLDDLPPVTTEYAEKKFEKQIFFGQGFGKVSVVTINDAIQKSNAPLVIAGIVNRNLLHWCKENKRDFYYIDTGYFGNAVQCKIKKSLIKGKKYSRITLNGLQYTGEIKRCSGDRLAETNVEIKPFTSGEKILICPPSQKAMNYWGMDLDAWLEDTVSTIKTHTDRPIEIRYKVPRKGRVRTNTLEEALMDNVHCLVTFNSIAATEALINGKPAFTLAPNAAAPMCLKDLTKIETPYIPKDEDRIKWIRNLAYQQFTRTEMQNGTAWRLLNDH